MARAWQQARADDPAKPGEFAAWLERRQKQDSDLWIVELDIAVVNASSDYRQRRIDSKAPHRHTRATTHARAVGAAFPPYRQARRRGAPGRTPGGTMPSLNMRRRRPSGDRMLTA
jgi:hypothetical protein